MINLNLLIILSVFVFDFSIQNFSRMCVLTCTSPLWNAFSHCCSRLKFLDSWFFTGRIFSVHSRSIPFSYTLRFVEYRVLNNSMSATCSSNTSGCCGLWDEYFVKLMKGVHFFSFNFFHFLLYLEKVLGIFLRFAVPKSQLLVIQYRSFVEPFLARPLFLKNFGGILVLLQNQFLQEHDFGVF